MSVSPKLAVMALRYTLIAILTLLACPVWAGERVQAVEYGEWNFNEPFKQATNSALRSLLDQALAVIEDHIEINDNIQPNKEMGARQGHFQLKVYPQGKSQSDDHFSADLRLRSFPDNRRFSLDLNVGKEASNDLPSSPDNTL